MRTWQALAVAAAPLAAALAALLAVALTGFDGRAALPPIAETRFYGFFLDRYPLFAFALVYGLARVLAAAAAPGPAGGPPRVVGAVFGLALLLAAGLHPTFGGIVLRAAFSTGSGAFLNGTPMPLAYAFGAAAGAGLFGLAAGIGTGLASQRAGRAPGGRLRRLGRALLGGLAGFIALWVGAAILGLGREAGIGPWPRRAFTGGEAVNAAAVIAAAALPHVLLIAIHLRSRPDVIATG